MEASTQEFEKTTSCRKAIIKGAAIGILVLILLGVWVQAVGFPYARSGAADLPLFPITLALMALNLPAIVTAVSVDAILPVSLEWLEYSAALAVHTGVYALLGAYWCKLTQNAQSKRRH